PGGDGDPRAELVAAGAARQRPGRGDDRGSASGRREHEPGAAARRNPDAGSDPPDADGAAARAGTQTDARGDRRRPSTAVHFPDRAASVPERLSASGGLPNGAAKRLSNRASERLPDRDPRLANAPDAAAET